MLASALMPTHAYAQQCVPRPVDTCDATGTCDETDTAEPGSLPRLTLGDIDYVGAFTFPSGTFGESTISHSMPIMETAGRSLFIVGHSHHDAIAEFIIPELVRSTDLAEINSTGAPVQEFSRVLTRAPSGNPETIDVITGMELIDGKLVVNAIEWYDGSGGNSDTTLVIDQPYDLSGSPVRGFFEMDGSARSAGWISPVPPAWQEDIGAPYIAGNSSSTSIISRHSVGPSAHALDPLEIMSASEGDPRIETTRLMEFSTQEPLSADLNNETGTNDLWTNSAGAWYGFIVPGTRTYAAFGYLAGGENGIGYKITQSTGYLCGGYCPYDVDDDHPYYWLFDVDDLLQVKRGERAPSSIRPYEHGVFPAPFQPEVGAYRIGGGTFDEESETLYLSLAGANRTKYSRLPVVTAYRFTHL